MTMGIQLDQPYETREKESFEFSYKIAKPFGEIDCIIAWCKAELDNEWRWHLVEVSSDARPGHYIFYFDSERDACAFGLKWG
jgi:hypothetical protein